MTTPDYKQIVAACVKRGLVHVPEQKPAPIRIMLTDEQRKENRRKIQRRYNSRRGRNNIASGLTWAGTPRIRTLRPRGSTGISTKLGKAEYMRQYRAKYGIGKWTETGKEA